MTVDYTDLKAALEWGATLPLTMEQRSALGRFAAASGAACRVVS